VGESTEDQTLLAARLFAGEKRKEEKEVTFVSATLPGVPGKKDREKEKKRRSPLFSRLSIGKKEK